MNKIYLGCHVSMSAPHFLLGSVNEAISYGANTFMIYTGAPQNSYRVPVNRLEVQKAHQKMLEAGIDKNNVIVHAPYIVNLANCLKEDIFEMSKRLIKIELQRTAALGFSILVLHPGTSLSCDVDTGINKIIEGLNEIFNEDHSGVIIALETMSGKGSECGTTISQLAKIINGVVHKERIGICLDTCHLHDYGYDLEQFDDLLLEIDQLIGMDKIKCLHINDSKNDQGSHKDRHENIGYGKIGFEVLKKIVFHPLLEKVPKILETPYIEGKAPYKHEISMFLKGEFVPIKDLL